MILKYIYKFKVREDHEKNFNLIAVLFRIFNKNLRNLNYTQTIDYLKNYIDTLKRNAVEEYCIFELPVNVLQSKMNYYLAKVLHVQKDYLSAIKYINNALESSIVMDAIIRRKCLKLKEEIVNILETDLVVEAKDQANPVKVRESLKYLNMVRRIVVEKQEETERKMRHYIFAVDGEMTSKQVMTHVINRLTEVDLFSVIKTAEEPSFLIYQRKKTEKTIKLLEKTVNQIFEGAKSGVFDRKQIINIVTKLATNNRNNKREEYEIIVVLGKVVEDLNIDKLEYDLNQFFENVTVFVSREGAENKYLRVKITDVLNEVFLAENLEINDTDEQKFKYFNEFYEV